MKCVEPVNGIRKIDTLDSTEKDIYRWKIHLGEHPIRVCVFMEEYLLLANFLGTKKENVFIAL